MTNIQRDRDPLNAYREGTVSRPLGSHDPKFPCPLDTTAIDVFIRHGFATVETSRTFRNTENGAIEATLTFPIPIDAALHGLVIEIDGRRLNAVSRARAEARETYEASIDAGTLAVLHEEVLRGIHMVSIGQLAPGATCTVISTWSAVTTATSHSRSLRIPTTVGEIYGRLPLNPADDLLPGSVAMRASLSVGTAHGTVTVLGSATSANGPRFNGEVDLGHAIDIVIVGDVLSPIEGRSAVGSVALQIASVPTQDKPLDLAILFDRSSSTHQSVRGDVAATVWSAMRDALSNMLQKFGTSDAVTLYEFDTSTRLVGKARGPRAANLTAMIGAPRGGTEIGLAIDLALRSGAKDILLLTDGRSGALDVHRLAATGARISAILVGPDSLEAMVGHLVALTGGSMSCASGGDATEHLEMLTAALRTRRPSLHISNALSVPESMERFYGTSRVTAKWSGDSTGPVDAVGAFAAAMALSTLTREAATEYAKSHGLCTHLTSLVLVDEAGAVQDVIPETRKVPLPLPYPAPMPHVAMVAPIMAAPAAMARPATPSEAAPMVAPPTGSTDHPGFLRRECSEESKTPSSGSSAASPRRVERQRSVFSKIFSWTQGTRGDEERHVIKTSELEAAGKKIDWSRHADRLANGNIDDLATSVRTAILRVASLSVVANYAKSRTQNSDEAEAMAVAIAAALAALAARTEDRSAARMLRRVIAKIGEADLLRLAASVGLLALTP